ncbi:sodium:solute symporter family protein [Pseudoxanthomonas wuyuanensis]|uniref:Cation/acetate symporter n=1 Tax=Pseudoxanthomonas wuyuanensis TaxID=1073196 RepID=A0A286D8H2_9GAMM|nr:sodium:solute symporter family protein [Pseudoxanthomonas wuyuanensis]KAF1720217.1 cation acetate symporter [Pseudoxanthomonas wuyuanensis]SOD54943.1 cation/acetate symporter [Pseudoxanthomonas wuyuanensis]
MATAKKDFVSNLPKIYSMYTGGFIAFVILLAIAEQMGMPNKIIGYIFMAATIGLYAMIGIMSRTAQVDEYYVAGRKVPAVFNGMAVGADWMSAASFIGMAGTLYVQGYDGLAYVMGWTGGYVLVALFLAPFLRKFGQYTIPDFLGARYGGNIARTVGIIAAITASFVYVVAQITGAGIIVSRFLEVPFFFGVFFGLGGILVCSMLGGMRAVTWTQVAQYIILIIAYLVPIVWLSLKVTGNPIPQIAYGEVLQNIAVLEQQLGVEAPHSTPFNITDRTNFLALTFCLMVGTAALPHILMRFFTTPSVKEARASVGWSLFFIFLLYFSAPAYAAFAKYEVYSNVVGQAIADLPAWVASWTQVGLVAVNDANGDGILQLAELTLQADAIVLATPEIAGLPYVIAGLVAAGGLAAALSTADGLLLTISNALSHDVYYKMVNPQASTTKRLTIARILLVMVAICAAAVAAQRPAGILALVAWAFSIAGAAFFPALVLGIFWKRANKTGAVAGMIVGFALTLFYLVGVQFMGMEKWFNINTVSAGIFGIPAGFLVIWIVSLLTKAPAQDVQDMVEDIRYPHIKQA